MSAGPDAPDEPASLRFDVVFAGDPRFPGGTTSATAGAIRAAGRLGLSIGFLGVRGPLFRRPRFVADRLNEAIDAVGAVRLDPGERVDCDILFAEHPMVFAAMPDRPTGLRPKAVVLVAHHPPVLADGRREYDPQRVVETLRRYFGAPVVVAPVGPKVRHALQAAGVTDATLTPEDLFNVIDPEAWALPARTAEPGRRFVVGRHARPDPLKWPDRTEDILAAWPDDPAYEIRILGGPPPSDRLPAVPGNWRILPFDPKGVRSFLAGLDAYVYLHSAAWTEAFGIAVAEAMAAGRVVILDPSFGELFEDGAIYARPSDVRAQLERLRAYPTVAATQAERGRALVARKFSPEAWGRRFLALRRHLGLQTATTGAAPVRRRAPPPRRILFVSSNGVGLGHLTRLMAVAARLPAGLQPVFFTLSQGAALVAQRGWPVDFVPSHQGRNLAHATWNAAFQAEFALALDSFSPAAVVFDGSMPYAGLCAVREARPDILFFWIRRALWRDGQNSAAVDRAPLFDAIIEPGELAAAEDVGATVGDRGNVLAVPPVLLHDVGDRLSRKAARIELGVDPDRPLVLIQLGSGVNYDLGRLRAAVLAHLARSPEIQVVEIQSPIAAGTDAREPGLAVRRVYPLHRVSRAADLLVTNAGYNAFHESVLSGVPSVFVPNEAPEMDDQLLRARYAESAGLGLALPAGALRAAGAVLDRGLEPGFAAEVARRAALLDLPNGAEPAARFIAETVRMLRTDRGLAEAILRI